MPYYYDNSKKLVNNKVTYKGDALLRCGEALLKIKGLKCFDRKYIHIKKCYISKYV